MKLIRLDSGRKAHLPSYISSLRVPSRTARCGVYVNPYCEVLDTEVRLDELCRRCFAAPNPAQEDEGT